MVLITIYAVFLTTLFANSFICICTYISLILNLYKEINTNALLPEFREMVIEIKFNGLIGCLLP